MSYGFNRIDQLPAHLREQAEKQMQEWESTPNPPATPVIMPALERRGKYNAQPTEVDGLRFASKAEARRYQQLVQMQQAGEITGLELQPAFTLLDGFTDRQGKRHRAIVYVADFRYRRGGEVVVEDVKGGKGTQTAQFRIKWKMAIFHYQGCKFELVGA